MEVGHLIGIGITLTVIVLLSVFSGKLTNPNKGMRSWSVFGAITGTLVGGSSTVGTAQLAFRYGMSAWWFTLGGGLACLVLALVFVKRFRESRCRTLTEIVCREYGERSGVTASVLSSVGNFINIISQLIAATAIIAVFWPALPHTLSLTISAAFMIVYIVFGGTKGSAVTGLFKMILLYATMVACGALVLVFTNGIGGFTALVGELSASTGVPLGSLFARGAGTDLGACLSLILGVVTTQAYAQPIFMANSTKEAKKGALLSAFLIPPVGIGGILVGLYMRAAHPDIVAKTALTSFVLEYFPPLVGGIILGALFIAVVGTGAGLALGIAAVIRNDILPRFKTFKSANGTLIERVCIVVLLLAAVPLSGGKLGDTILSFAFLSMGLRGATLLLPLCCALWLSKKVDHHFVMAAIILGPATVAVFGVWNVLPFDPLFAGVLAASVVMAIGWFVNRNTPSRLSAE